jgi:hypothetical protein
LPPAKQYPGVIVALGQQIARIINFEFIQILGMAEEKAFQGAGKHAILLGHYCGLIFSGAAKSCSNFADLRGAAPAILCGSRRDAGRGGRFHG